MNPAPPVTMIQAGLNDVIESSRLRLGRIFFAGGIVSASSRADTLLWTSIWVRTTRMVVVLRQGRGGESAPQRDASTAGMMKPLNLLPASPFPKMHILTSPTISQNLFFLFGFTIILVALGVTILPPEITRRAVLFGVKFCLREKPLSSPLPSAAYRLNTYSTYSK